MRAPSKVPTGHAALVQELRDRGEFLVRVLAREQYSRSRYYRRLHELGEPPADVVVLIADSVGISRRDLLAVSEVI